MKCCLFVLFLFFALRDSLFLEGCGNTSPYGQEGEADGSTEAVDTVGMLMKKCNGQILRGNYFRTQSSSLRFEMVRIDNVR